VTLSAPVSILVVVERPRRPRTASRTTAVRSCFNPCCGGTTSPTRPAPAPRGGERGFNPCCGGTTSPTADPRHAPGPADRVSILVVVERPRRPQASYEAAKVGEVSILVVVERPRRRRETDGGHPVAGRVSILVVVERPRRLNSTTPDEIRVFEFQSLLWWNDLADRPYARSRRTLLRFQSLLWWNDLADSKVQDYQSALLVFQSLLWWNDLADVARSRAWPRMYLRFQSLLWWNDLADAGGRP